MDSINSGIGSGGYQERGAILFFTIFIIAFFASIFMLVQFIFIPRLKLRNSLKSTILIVVGIFCFYEGVVGAHQLIYSHKANLYFDKNIELLAPYVGIEKAMMAKSKFRRIQDKATMDTAQSYIIELSKEVNIEIEPF